MVECQYNIMKVIYMYHMIQPSKYPQNHVVVFFFNLPATCMVHTTCKLLYHIVPTIQTLNRLQTLDFTPSWLHTKCVLHVLLLSDSEAHNTTSMGVLLFNFGTCKAAKIIIMIQMRHIHHINNDASSLQFSIQLGYITTRQ